MELYFVTESLLKSKYLNQQKGYFFISYCYIGEGKRD